MVNCSVKTATLHHTAKLFQLTAICAYLFSMMFCWTIWYGKRPGNEIVLDIDNNQSIHWTDYLSST